MKRFRVEVALEAREQFDEIVRWRVENSLATDALRREVKEALALLSHRPDAGYAAPRIAGVRRILLRKTQHLLYYRVDRAAGIVRIVAIWHSARGSEPPL
jgi:plasmid stabilization system protein ParE